MKYAIKNTLGFAAVLVTGTVFSFVPIAGALTAANTVPDTYTLLEPLPCIPSPAALDTSGKAIPGTEVSCNNTNGKVEMKATVDFQTYIQYAFNLIIALAAVAAVVMIIWGGIEYMTTDSWDEKSDGKKKLKDAIVGLVLILSSYLILRTVDPRLVAIPSTLVPPLNISSAFGYSQKFFEDLKAETDKIDKQQADTRAAVAADEKKVAELAQNLQDQMAKAEELKSSLDQSASSQLAQNDADQKSTIAEIQRTQADARLEVSKAGLNRIVNGHLANLGSDDQDINKELNDLEEEFQKQNYALNQAGADPDQIKVLSDYKEYSAAKIKINYETAGVNQVVIDYNNIVGISKGVDLVLNTHTKDSLQELKKQQDLSVQNIKNIQEEYKSTLGVSNPDLYKKLNDDAFAARTTINTTYLTPAKK